MFTQIEIIVVIGVIAITIYFFLSMILKNKYNRIIKTRDASLTCEELEDYAKKAAIEHSIGKNAGLINWPIPRMNENYEFILSLYISLNDDVRKKQTIPPAAEWLLDNFYIIEEQVNSLKRDMKKSEYARLPMLKCGVFKGYARIYAVAVELVAHTDGQIDENIIMNYLKAYQSHSTLLDRELWALPAMIRVALIENIRNICEKIKDTQYYWSRADEIIDSWLKNEVADTDKLIKSIKLKAFEEIHPPFIEHLSFRLRREKHGYTKVLRNIDDSIAKYGIKVEELTKKEHNSQAVSTVSMGNSILGLKYISSFEWIDVFEETSNIEKILIKDPDGTYPIMDFASRNYYRGRIEELADEYKVSEIHIAEEALLLAKSAYENNDIDLKFKSNEDNKKDERKVHIGFYLIGKGVNSLEKKIGHRTKPFKKFVNTIKSHPQIIYIGGISLITLIIVGLASSYTFLAASRYKLLFSIITGLAVLIPSSEIVINLVNWVVCNVKKPSAFARLELKDGIPENISTMIVMPALIPDEKRVIELLENLELHYLSNKEENLYFALVGDFKDSDMQSTPEDIKIIDTALNRINELNLKHSINGFNKFYFLYRERKFNESHKKWMGWERKRGALIEFNDLLLGFKDTSFMNTSDSSFPVSKVKYVITLDADTILPISMAKKMIGTMAHVLNRPIIDEKRGIVVDGYGLIQPRVSFDVESSNKTLFSRIFTGQEGIDPYACAVSDVYQDLFGEGIFTGKGIYDLKVFQRILKNAIQDNTIISHDLLEGSYIRAGLVTDLELIDSYPSRYNSYTARMHRWVRGDWQLIPWLRRKIVDRENNYIVNPLSLISRWKIIDNLRRSLVSPSVMLFFILAFSLLPGRIIVWLGLAILFFLFPLLTAVLETMSSRHNVIMKIKRHIPVISGLKATFFQQSLMFIFLPFQAKLMLNAITVTLIRVFYTKKNMIEWVTAADVERGQSNTFGSYWSKMRTSLLPAFLIVILSWFFRPAELSYSVLLMLIWSFSPYIAYRISNVHEMITFKPSYEDIMELRKIARKTWRYFEEFANFKNHYLAPDNYQEDPPRGIAYRTSPTNIGLGLLATLSARDFGYIGTMEMAEIISNTITTIEKMEKWNGHLYNWYDTRTLRPLRPRYVSTVDSGNLVCYLITLLQGLNGYLNSTLIDKRFIDGITDTVKLIGKEGTALFEELNVINEALINKNLDVSLWNKALIKLLESCKGINTIKSPWKNKAEHMLKMFKREASEFMSWGQLLQEIPMELLKQDQYQGIKDAINRLLNVFNSNFRLKEIPKAYSDGLVEIDLITDLCKSINEKYYKSLLNWLVELRAEVEKSIERTEKFINFYNELMGRINDISTITEFIPLYVKKKQLFSIGYNIEENRLTNSYYDLLASEARQTSYIAIARGEVPSKHWFKMGRAITVVDNYKGLVSWTGTMFEYLMPLIIMKSYKNTLLDETYSFVIRSQKKYGKQRSIPWGASESGFYSLDLSLDYQYKAIGVPWLGLKRGLIEDAVTSPYSTFLALMLDPEGALANINLLKSEGLDGPYGFYEAVDYTTERLPFGSKAAVVKSFMAHHQGMSLLSLNNYLNFFIMQKRFHSDPTIKAAQLLLQEKVPTSLVFTKENKEKVMPYKDTVYKEKGTVRKFKLPDTALPKVHILSNGNYSVMITDKGTGYSRNKVAAVTRWREDSALDKYGMFFYLRNTDTNLIWSSTFSPLNIQPEKYEVMFSHDKAKFRRIDGKVETDTEIVVTPVDNAEIRRITVKNHSQIPYTIEITSYFEIVLATQAADIAHPAFSNLFVKTEFVADKKCIIASRRPRTDTEKSLWIANTAVVEGETVGDLQFETDRAQFIGRGRDVTNPIEIDLNRPLSNTIGPVLDPVMSQRVLVRIEPGKQAKISFITAVSESFEALLDIVERYSSPDKVEGAFRLALTRSQVEARYLNIKNSEIELYQDLISHILFISPLRRMNNEIILQNHKGQTSLWPYGISGDLPIVLLVLKKSDEVDMLYEVLKMHEYWRAKDLRVDLIILNHEENSYTHPLYALLSDIVSSSQSHEIINRPGGIFILNWGNLSLEDINLLYAAARLVLKGDSGSLADQIKKIQNNQPQKQKHFVEEYRSFETPAFKEPELDYFNGLGGFIKDGTEYVIRLERGQNTPMPWINVISNSKFGFLVSESGSGYTWCENSRENKLTPWSNDPVSDSSGEVFYVSDDETGGVWTITPLPIREEEPYFIKHGFGYSVFEHVSHGIEQNIVQFVPVNEAIKISIIKFKNISKYSRDLNVTYYVKPVLGVNDNYTALHIVTKLEESGTLVIDNPYNEEFAGRIAFIDASVEDRCVTGDRKEFFGSGDIRSPQALKQQKLSGTVGIGYDPCAAMQININLKENEEKEVVFLLGMNSDLKEISLITSKYKNIENARQALEDVKNFWKEKLKIIKVNTPDLSMNIMLNGWILYQVISCRMWSRSAFYQSGGAYGFRDQLQDCLPISAIWPEKVREQILLHAKHQFIEGDVQHWWHEPYGKGTRTRFSDDLLWLPYVVCEYVQVTGDRKILWEEVTFIEDENLKEFEDERYSTPVVSSLSSTVYDHCIRAIEKALRFGKYGLPLMGSGDWNDGMNTVGNRGIGESVWLGWFLNSVLVKFSSICRLMEDEKKAGEYLEVAQKLADSIEKNAWDGNWYRRAYFDNGVPLGSMQNSECKIDSIAQSWSVISGAGNIERAEQAMISLENYLVQRDEGIIKLLAPPFDEGDLEPGYIKGYVPGVRENGGQYTHAAAWVIIAIAQLGDGDKAWELFELINPINHTRTHIEYSTYKVEPYVMAADVYAAFPHIGRGGWTWYTGSAGWIYRAGIESILGFKKNGEVLSLDPCIPQKWSEYEIQYKYLDTIYEIRFKNPEGVNKGVKKVTIDGVEDVNKCIPVINDRAKHIVEVVMGNVKN